MKKNNWITFWKEKARDLQLQTYALSLAIRDPRLPWYARAWIGLVVAYAFSPIDLIPDFIPIIGYLDDLILLPLGVLLALKMIPAPLLQEYREKARERLDSDEPSFKWMGAIILAIWILVILAVVVWLVRKFLRVL
jgi:uncharacterized membrane protein YkvA (DUF1232 family)